eukprot:6172472-Pleurochrysis_carterae.AAC.2
MRAAGGVRAAGLLQAYRCCAVSQRWRFLDSTRLRGIQALEPYCNAPALYCRASPVCSEQ